MDNKDAKEILEKYAKGICTPDETAWVESWYLAVDFQMEAVTEDEVASALTTTRKSALNRPKIRRLMFKISAAAAVILLFAAAILFTTKKSPPTSARLIIHDALPGSNKATLTLGNGTQIVLSNAKNGSLVSSAGSTITKPVNGRLVYTSAGTTSIVESNTLKTPKGGKYQIMLPDGSKVWLNAASSITFPTSFSGRSRRVAITGEAYFEVAKDKLHPFIVHTGKADVRVLGTHFNIKSYADDEIWRVTLLQGSVNVKTDQSTITIRPGQQAVVDQKMSVAEVNAPAEAAWKDGWFHYDNTSLKDIMRQMERWYDVEIDDSSMPERHFTGNIKMDIPLSEVIKILEITGELRFTINDKKVKIQ